MLVKFFLVLTIILASLLNVSALAQTEYYPFVVSVSGDIAPGLDSEFSSFEEYYILKNGDVYFKAFTNDGNFGWWLKRKGEGVVSLIHSEYTFPTLSGNVSDITVRMDNSGNVIAFIQTSDEWNLYQWQNDSWDLLIYSDGIVTPLRQYTLDGEEPLEFQLYGNPGAFNLMLNNGNIALIGERLFQLNNRNTYDGIIGINAEGEISTQIVSSIRARTAQEIQSNTLLYDYLDYDSGYWSPTLNSQGKSAFAYHYSYEDSSISRGVLVVHDATDASFSIYADDYSTEFSHLRFTAVNNEGMVGVIGSLPEDGNGIWVSEGNNMELVIGVGDEAPEADGGSFIEFASMQFLDGGGFGFRAAVSGEQGNRWGIWYYDGSQIHKIQLEGDFAPELGEGMVFENPIHYSLDSTGSIAIWNGNFAGDKGLWMGKVGEELTLLTIPGGQISLSENDIRSIVQVRPNGIHGLNNSDGENGIPISINSEGVPVFKLQFSDGSSALMTDIINSSLIIVNSTGDGADQNVGDNQCNTGGTIANGQPECTLRAALQEVQSEGWKGNREIFFDIPEDDSGFDATTKIFTITPGEPLPSIIVDSVNVYGTTQPEYVETPLIVIDGVNVFEEVPGFKVTASHFFINGLAIVRFKGDGILFESTSNSTISEMLFGKHPASNEDFWGNRMAGIRLKSTSTVNYVLDSEISYNWEQGVLIEEGDENFIGYNTAEYSNTIEKNRGDGIAVFEGEKNYFGINSIYDNDGLGINLDPEPDSTFRTEVTFNDYLDDDIGPNGLINFPGIFNWTATTVYGMYRGKPNTSYYLYFYGNDQPVSGEFPEGQEYLGYSEITTNEEGIALIEQNLGDISGWYAITAYAQDFENNTSEFSVPELLVTSTADNDDSVPGDGQCFTGNQIDWYGFNIPECTLRAAIQEANELYQGEYKYIPFHIAQTDTGFKEDDQIFVISPGSALPTITEPIWIDGLSQPESGEYISIQLDGINLDEETGASGLVLSAIEPAVYGLSITRFPGNGISIDQSSAAYLYYNLIGEHPVTSDVNWGNNQSGIEISGGSESTQIYTSNIINNAASGVRILNGDNSIIGELPFNGGSNFIYGNGGDGVWILNGSGNFIGINSIWNNGGIAINLDEDFNPNTNDSRTPNDDLDIDLGANGLLNHPEIIEVADSLISVQYQGAANSLYGLYFYANSYAEDDSDLEAGDFLFVDSLRTNEAGFASAIFQVSGVTAKDFISVMAVDKFLNSSEFSNEYLTSISTEHLYDLPLEMELSQNYPNPFNPSTNIGFKLGNQNIVTLKVFDVLGREVATLIDEKSFNSGAHTISFNATGLASGVYIYQLEAGGFIQTRRMVLLK